MTYRRVGGESGFFETLFTFIFAVVFMFAFGVIGYIAGIAWATLRYFFLRGMFLYGQLDQVRAESDGDPIEFVP